jgi:uncharacterized membrane protein
MFTTSNLLFQNLRKDTGKKSEINKDDANKIIMYWTIIFIVLLMIDIALLIFLIYILSKLVSNQCISLFMAIILFFLCYFPFIGFFVFIGIIIYYFSSCRK